MKHSFDFTPAELGGDSFIKQWRLGQLMLAIMVAVSALALYLAWKTYQPQQQIDWLVKENLLFSNKVEKINATTSFALYAQIKLVDDHRRNGEIALWASSFSRQQLQSSLESLSSQVAVLSGQLDRTVELDQAQASTIQDNHFAIQVAAAQLSHEVEVFQALNANLIESLSPQKGAPLTNAADLEVQAHRVARRLNAATVKLSDLMRSQYDTLLRETKDEGQMFLRSIMAISVFAIVWNALLLILLGRSLKRNAAMAKALSIRANIDSLTGLLNRRALTNTIAKRDSSNRTPTAWPSDQRAVRSIAECLVVIDLDHFKRYNDTFGHPQGDAHLQACARIWSDNLRAEDVLARLGGEEFAILLSHCSAQDAQEMLRRMQSAMPVGTTFSAGVAMREGEEPFESWFKKADIALYRAKNLGRARVEVASEGQSMSSSA